MEKLGNVKGTFSWRFNKVFNEYHILDIKVFWVPKQKWMSSLPPTTEASVKEHKGSKVKEHKGNKKDKFSPFLGSIGWGKMG